MTPLLTAFLIGVIVGLVGCGFALSGVVLGVVLRTEDHQSPGKRYGRNGVRL